MQIQRSSERRKVFYYLLVENLENNQPLGRLGDISEQGVMLLSSHALPLETRFEVAVHLPQTSSFLEKTLELTVETRWQKQDVNPDILCIGCQLIEAGKEKEDVLEKLIEYYGFSEGYKEFRQS